MQFCILFYANYTILATQKGGHGPMPPGSTCNKNFIWWCCPVLEFPLGCEAFEGSHSVDCLSAMWLESGCLPQGSGFPENFDFEENDTLLNLNLRYFYSYIMFLLARFPDHSCRQLDGLKLKSLDEDEIS